MIGVYGARRNTSRVLHWLGGHTGPVLKTPRGITITVNSVGPSSALTEVPSHSQKDTPRWMTPIGFARCATKTSRIGSSGQLCLRVKPAYRCDAVLLVIGLRISFSSRPGTPYRN